MFTKAESVNANRLASVKGHQPKSSPSPVPSYELDALPSPVLSELRQKVAIQEAFGWETQVEVGVTVGNSQRHPSVLSGSELILVIYLFIFLP